MFSDLSPRGMSAVVLETTPHMFVSQTRGEKLPDKSVSLEDEGRCGVFEMTPQPFLCILLMRMMSADTLSSHRPGDGASLLGVSDP